MRKILATTIGAIAFILFLWATPTAMPDGHISRDWAKNPAIVQIERQPERLFAMGDVHGDFDRMVALLVRAGLIDTKAAQAGEVHWTGGNAVLVVTGDMVDKGPHSVAVIRLLAAMREAARRSGGQVVITMGNHEAEFLAGLGKAGNKSKGGDLIDDLTLNGVDRGSVEVCRGDIGQFLCSLPFGARVGEWFFSHAGNTGGRTIAELNLALEDGVRNGGFNARELSDPNSLLDARLGEGKVWFHPADKARTEREILAADAAALGVSHMVQGHQPGDVEFADGVVRHKGEMFQRWGLLFLIDTGMSRDVDDSKGALLSITLGANAVAICPDGTETPLWDRKSLPDASRAGPCTH
jgi:hypothetical protein